MRQNNSTIFANHQKLGSQPSLARRIWTTLVLSYGLVIFQKRTPNFVGPTPD